MTKDLVLIDKDDNILVAQPELKDMMVNIQEALPEIKRATQNFGKRQSQFMDNILTVSKPTPLRNMRQITAEMDKTFSALRESSFKQRKTRLEAMIKFRDAETEDDLLKREIMEIEGQELLSQLDAGQNYISGAIRKLENYREQYALIEAKVMADQGVTEFSEIDFELEEEKYHIMVAFSQGLDSVRSSGRIDQGNQIYLQQLGINGAVAQACMMGLVQLETNMMQEGNEPTNELVLQFLEDMANKFAGCSDKIAEHKGMKTFTASAAIEPKLLTEEK